MEKEVDGIADFDPTKYGLQESFCLTDYAALKGWGCKVPEKILLKLLQGLIKHNEEQRTEVSQSSEPRLGTDIKMSTNLCLCYSVNDQICNKFGSNQSAVFNA